MSEFEVTDDLFFTRAGLDKARTQRIVEDALAERQEGVGPRSLVADHAGPQHQPM